MSKERVAAYNKKYYWEHKEENRERCRRWREENAERYREYQHQQYLKRKAMKGGGNNG